MTDIMLAQGFSRRIGALAQRLGAAASDARVAAAAAAMVSAATANGHVCIELAALARQLGQPPDTVRASLLASGVATCIDDDEPAPRLPLVIDTDDRLYLARYYEFERGLANALSARAQAEFDDVSSDDAQRWRNVLSRYFGEANGSGLDWQRVAAAVALSGQLTIVSGGPGTGKTTTVVGVLACLLDAKPDLRIALAAPTGKAAQRMLEALASRTDRLAHNIAARLPTASYTLHRLLGSTPDRGFRHHRRNPLPYDVIVVDEASMIDVALASRLVDAVAPRARLILLGDKDQLAAVDAGAVFAELSAHLCYVGQRAERIAQALGCTANTLRNALAGYVRGGLPQREHTDLLPDGASYRALFDTLGVSADKQNPLDRRTAILDPGIADVPPIALPSGDSRCFLPTQAVAPMQPATQARTATPAQLAASAPPDTPTPPSAPAQRDLFADDNPADGAGIIEPAPKDTARAADGAQPAALANCVVWLQTNYRFGLDSPIGQLSSAIRDGSPADALGVLETADDRAPAYFINDSGPALGHTAREYIARGFARYADLLAGMLQRREPQAGALFDALNAFRVLCAVRAGPHGVDALNEWVSAELRRVARLPLASAARWFAGRPVIVTRNDYALGLFNGDIGIALPAGDGALRVVFEQGAEQRRSVSPAMLPSHDTAFALTVHKSQGSEFERAALVLPPTFSRALSRELIYTAVTRARAQIAIIGTHAVLAQSIGTPTRRDTGLSARLRYAAARAQRETASSR
ncbi:MULTISPECIES: AAA family ATPase [Mycetohabitans]|uniref:RecBCD enzyme subunit RecD n=1 Tax=Mycetohabitans endofungorum TaxID=417203 RepID=A0A2P5K796_9BURK|nr:MULTISPECIES: AAA family ATPase [Mycetohabitans]PPB81956.1 exodeoxyribonuclease V alpha subunit [Mycetohabitans endofungorum]